MLTRISSILAFVFSFILIDSLSGWSVYADQKTSNILTAEGGDLLIAQETTQIISVLDHMKEVTISDADVIDVVVLDSRNLRLISKNRGFSDLIVFDDDGAVIGQVKIQVLPPKSSTITIHRNGTLSTYDCLWGVCDFSAKQVQQAFASVGILTPSQGGSPSWESLLQKSTTSELGASSSARLDQSSPTNQASRTDSCASQQGLCIAQCKGDGQCIGSCAARFGICIGGAQAQNAAPAASQQGICMGSCAAQEGLCIAQCNGDGQCIGQCAATKGQCVARCAP